MKLNYITLAILTAAIAFLLLGTAHQPWPPLRIVGAAISALSLVLVVIARFQLGNSFSVRAKATRLITTGLYRKIRNPIYLFGCIFFAGIALFLSSMWPLLLLIFIIPMQIVRSRREANVLQKRFGEEYTKYRASTWL